MKVTSSSNFPLPRENVELTEQQRTICIVEVYSVMNASETTSVNGWFLFVALSHSSMWSCYPAAEGVYDGTILKLETRFLVVAIVWFSGWIVCGLVYRNEINCSCPWLIQLYDTWHNRFLQESDMNSETFLQKEWIVWFGTGWVLIINDMFMYQLWWVYDRTSFVSELDIFIPY